jgi:hypothetical protein
MSEDPQRDAWRYRIDRLTDDQARADNQEGPDTGPPSEPPPAPTAAQRAAFVETELQQAIRRGEFDNLPGAGKPLDGLSDRHDPDWWIRRKIEREQLSGLGPPALTLRVESAQLHERLDRIHREDEVRTAVEDFNHRVIEARRQLLGGPPVVTPVRDVAAEVDGWRERRERRRRELAAQQAEASAERADRRRRWWMRRS